MRSMFNNCSSLLSINLSNFKTEKVTDMGDMFYKCSNLTTLDISNFNTTNVLIMTCMFSGMKHITSLDLSNFNTSSLTEMNEIFYNCSNLIYINASYFYISTTSNIDIFNEDLPLNGNLFINEIFLNKINIDLLKYKNWNIWNIFLKMIQLYLM